MSIVDKKLINRDSQLIRDFEIYLSQRGVSDKTLRNYRSDLYHFFSFVQDNFSVLHESSLIANFSPEGIEKYKQHHFKNQTPLATLNRRLSTLRSFARFLKLPYLIQNVSDSGLKQSISGSRKVLLDYKKHLVRESVAAPTLRNYLSDVRHFLAWIEANKISG